MAKSDETNNKLPKPAPMTVKPEYPYVYEEQTLNGKKITRHDNPDKPEESFESTFNHDGSFETKQISEDYKGLTTGLSHEARTYVSGGSSSHIDGNHDNNSTDNVKTYCKLCHNKKSIESGDCSNKKESARIFNY